MCFQEHVVLGGLQQQQRPGLLHHPVRGEAEALELAPVQAPAGASEAGQAPPQHDHQRHLSASETGSPLCDHCQVCLVFVNLNISTFSGNYWKFLSFRRELSKCVGGRSILDRIDKLPCHQDLRKIVKFECATSKREQVIRKLHRFFKCRCHSFLGIIFY